MDQVKFVEKPLGPVVNFELDKNSPGGLIEEIFDMCSKGKH